MRYGNVCANVVKFIKMFGFISNMIILLEATTFNSPILNMCMVWRISGGNGSEMEGFPDFWNDYEIPLV